MLFRWISEGENEEYKPEIMTSGCGHSLCCLTLANSLICQYQFVLHNIKIIISTQPLLRCFEDLKEVEHTEVL